MNRVVKPAVLPLGAGLALALMGLTVPLPAASQSLDCFDAQGPVAQLICGDAVLREIDGAMGDAFRELVRSTPRSERPVVLRSQRDWLAVRNDCLSAANVPECLRTTTERRISNLSQGISSFVAADPAPAEPLPVDPNVDTRPLGDLPGTGAPVGSTQNQSVAGTAPVQPLPPPRVDGGVGQAGVTPPPASTTLPPVAATEGPVQPPAAEVAPEPPALGDADSARLAEYLSASVWRAEIASGVRPGTIFLFYANGALVTADCVEAYDIGNWRVEGNGLRLEDGRKKQSTAEILEADQYYVRLLVTEGGTGRELTLVLRPAKGPFACTNSG